MRKKALKHFRDIVSWIIVLAMLINSSSLSVGAAQPTSRNQNEQIYECDGYTVTFKLETEWNSGYNAAVIIQNTGSATISDWYMYLKYDGEILNVWNATIYDRPEHYYVLTNAGWNKDVYVNGSASFGFTGSGEFPGFPETIKVTSGYDPSALDSGNNHGDDVIDEGVDTDGDGLSDALEEAIGSDPQLVDTDGDGLSDYQELYLTGTDPLLTDTDGNGVSDADEDVDADGLTNLEEFIRGTDVANYDSDRDDLSDYDEIHEYGTNPLLTDTDGDGLCDGDDVLLGFSPTMPDTDMNGIPDSAEKIYQSTENNFEYEDAHGLTSVSISLDISGNIEKEIEITNVYDFDVQSREVVGIIGAPIEITSDVEFDTATISFSYDESALGDTLEENLSLMWYDEENNWYQVLDQDCVVDPVNNTVSYTTTHFSKYFLVDVSKWFSVWIDDIDYGDVGIGEGERSKEVDLIVVYDNDAYTEDGFSPAFSSAYYDYEFPSWLNKSGLVFFHEGVSAWYGTTGPNPYKNLFLDEEGTVWCPYHGDTMDSVLRSIMYRLDLKPEVYENDDKIVVIVSDGGFKIGDAVINECKDYGIKIYSIDVEHGENYVNFKRMSNLTGGQYYYGEILEDPEFLWDCIVYDSGERLEGGDRDGDGLLDVYETEGMRTLTGILIKTDAYKKDSDGDTLTDSEETGPVYSLNLYIGRGITKSVRLIVPNSDPTLVDSDGDGMSDNDDPHPMKKEKIEVTLKNIYGIDYLSVGGLDGGYQGWWPDIYGGYDETIAGNWEGYYNYVLDPNYRISHFGCGLIAMTDLELYLAQQNGYYIPHNEYPYPNGGYIIDKDKYMRLVEYNRDNVYYLSDYFYNFKIGVTPVDMVRGIENFLVYNGEASADASWMYFDQNADPIDTIERMISENIPIVFSYYVDGVKIPLYFSEENAINHLTGQGYATLTNSHYMTIIGYTKYLEPDSNHYRYVLKVVSWGKIYYINFDEYVDHMNLYTSILEISR